MRSFVRDKLTDAPKSLIFDWRLCLSIDVPAGKCNGMDPKARKVTLRDCCVLPAKSLN